MAIGWPVPLVPSHTEPTPSTVDGAAAASPVIDGVPVPVWAGAGGIVHPEPRQLAGPGCREVSPPAAQMSEAERAAIAVSEDSCGSVLAVQLLPSKRITT